MRVTVVDDDRDVLALFRELFESRGGFEVTTFADVLPGIGVLLESRPDLLVVDLALAPEREQLSGFQVIHSARSSSKLRNIPIVVSFTDQRAMDDAWGDLMARGDIHQLAKPFGLETFERVVDAALGRVHDGPDRAEIHAIDGEERSESRG